MQRQLSRGFHPYKRFFACVEQHSHLILNRPSERGYSRPLICRGPPMLRPGLFALRAGLLVLSGGTIGQENKTKQETKKEEAKKEDPAPKLKGVLPPNYGKLGLSEMQVQEIYKIQNKYDPE